MEEKPYTNEQILDTLPNGSVIQFNDEWIRWMKLDGRWYTANDGHRMHSTNLFNDMDLHVKYWGDL